MKARMAAGERGSALIYILIAIALLALLTSTFMESSSQQTQSQNSFKLVSELSSQVELIRSAAQECVIAFPGGDINTIPPIASPAINKNHPYPLIPDDAYFSNCGATPAAGGSAADKFASHLRCPGKPGDVPCHTPIFSAAAGRFMPQPPALFGQWQWYNGDDGIFFWIETAKSDAFIETALIKLEEQYADCEADVIDATASDVAMSTDIATVECPQGSRCFRLWMVRGAVTTPTCP